MSGGIGEIDPRKARTAAAYVVSLRRLKERSGMSYREIARRSRATGNELPPSTAATMLSRRTLPRARLVAQLLIACGEPPDAVARWLGVHARLAGRQELSIPRLSVAALCLAAAGVGVGVGLVVRRSLR